MQSPPPRRRACMQPRRPPHRPVPPLQPHAPLSRRCQRRRCSPSHTLARWPSLLSSPTRSARTQTSRRCARRPSRAPCFALAPAARAGALPAHRASVRPPRPVTYHEMRRLALLVARRAKHTGAPACAPSRRSAAMAEPGAGAEGECVCGHPECVRRGREREPWVVKPYGGKETALKHFSCTVCGVWRALHCARTTCFKHQRRVLSMAETNDPEGVKHCSERRAQVGAQQGSS
jgi:hypothetical protein